MINFPSSPSVLLITAITNTQQTQVPPQLPTQSAFRSRRSYPSLHHVSLAPLNPRFLTDDDEEASDYFNHPHQGGHHDSPDPPTARSYLASFSVPGTPGVLSHSHSRSGSRARHHSRSKSSSRLHHASDPNLQAQSASNPLHHDQQLHGQTHRATRSTNRPRHPPQHHQDTEWMLRAGIALASSTREEKGQSWLVKRQSSTSLVSDEQHLSLDFLNQHDHHNPWSAGGSSPRHGRSGRSTPAAAYSRSRRASRSRPSSRMASRADLAMTSIGMTPTTTSTATSSRRESRTVEPLASTSTSTQKVEQQQQQDKHRHLVPDFVDERIRAEMASLQRDELDEDEEDDDFASFASDYPYADSDSESDELDEQELQRLTRERGFGLGSWIDRMVEWTLFGVEDWPLPFGGSSNSSDLEPRTVTISDHHSQRSADTVKNNAKDDNEEDDTASPDAAAAAAAAEDTDTISIAESETLSVLDKPGDQGGWGDAGWLFRAVRHALS
ncbi:DUF3984 domain-containing protein [Aspergillus homomorphus CBS 101889]|uniref:Uncharacterized protein n=1 Tax=Aspergillus homomorphus (strain CBS 101889) TaxID=1450537 RepID=A0A395HNF8_ASPHC|nr:hypothetical protein BO97DRAFT_445841 [Aspergillus homomorphus CBS 101889]RAL09019.1 hypothetical protein BO97DRAFT_445841 [Aspergillus homomorphus CBS 101889]